MNINTNYLPNRNLAPVSETDLEAQTITLDRSFKIDSVEGCDNINEIIEALKLGDYTKEEIPEVCAGYARILDDYGNPISIVRDTYDLLQPLEAFAFLDSLKEVYGFKYSRAGFTHGGRRLFISAEAGDMEPNTRKKGDIINKRVTAYTSFDGTTGTAIVSEALRVWCNNGMANWVKDRNINLSVRHTKNQRNFIAEALSQATGIKMLFQKLEEDIERLDAQRVTPLEMNEISNRYFDIHAKPDNEISTRTRNAKELVDSHFHNEELGTFGVSGWDAVNAFTAYITHDKNYRDTTTSSKLENNYRAQFNPTGVRKFRNIIKEVVGV